MRNNTYNYNILTDGLSHCRRDGYIAEPSLQVHAAPEMTLSTKLVCAGFAVLTIAETQ